MSKKTKSIPVNLMANEFGSGMAIERLVINNLEAAGLEDGKRPHREDGHSFFLLESGTVTMEIDFKKHQIAPLSIIYMHPSQVHRIITFENVTVTSWSITEEQLNPDYLKMLEDIAPAEPLILTNETFSLISEAVSLCDKFFKRQRDKVYHLLLKDSCNALVALATAQFLQKGKPADTLSRFEIITKDFKKQLERNYTTCKRPSEYAEKLHLSIPYLNECVKNNTGHTVSHHIQQRIILEAKRLLSHSDKAVKEIAAELGYDDFPYFSRLFTKVAGMTAVTFRHRNCD